MANLETLELTVNGSAKSASEGIDKLIHSLSALSDAITKPFSDLSDFNAELKKMKDLCGAINLPNIAKATGASRAVSKAKSKGDIDLSSNNNKTYIPPAQTAESMQKDAEWYAKFRANATADYEQRKAYHDWATQRRQAQADAIQQEARAKEELAKVTKQAYADAVQAEKAAMNVRGEDTRAIMEQSTKLDLLILKQEALRMETISLAKEGKLTAKQIADRSMQYQKLGSEIEKLKAQTNQTKEATKELEEQTKDSAKDMSKSIEGVKKSSSGLLYTIGRIFKTMLIRTAIRALLKAAKEGLDNYYKYSKQMGGSFAASMDQVNTKWNQIKNQIGAGIGTALSALLPLLNTVAKAVLFVLNTFTALFALLNGQTTYSEAVEVWEDYEDAIGGAGKAAKQWLASFDELNVMTQGTGGGGAGGGGFGDMFKEVELPQWMVEWKPIIEAILGGVLGAIILPKIWDWIKKIFNLFTGDVAETAMDFVGDLLNKDSTLPSLSQQAIDMAAFGAGAAAAAAALPVVSEYIEKIVAALDGVSLLGSLLGLIGELLKKAFEAIPVPIKLDTEEYDEFKKKHDEWIKKIDEKNVKVKVENDAKNISKLTMWVGTVEEKIIKVELYNDIEAISKLSLWVGTEETKKINVKLVENEFEMVLFRTWVDSTPNKYVNIILLDQVNGINRVQEWIDAEAIKTIDIEINMPEGAAGTAFTGGGGSKRDGGSSFWDDLFGKPVWELDAQWWDDCFRKPIWELGKSNPVEINLGEVSSITGDEQFIKMVNNYISGSVDKVLSASNIATLKKMFPTLKATDIVVVSNWDKLSDDARGQLVSALFTSFGSKEAISALKATIPNIRATEIIKTVDWGKFTIEQQFNFLNALKEAFGAKEALQAAQDAGINIGVLVQKGMQTGNPKIQESAEEWAKIIKKGTESDPPVVKPDLDNKKTKTIADTVKKTIEDLKPTVTVNKITVPKEQTQGVKDTIEKVDPVVNPQATVTDDMLQNVKNKIESVKPEVTATVKAGSFDGFTKSFKGALSGIQLSLVNAGITTLLGTLTAKASGGFVDSGDIFVANENGVPEMVGSFGNRTAVANTDQIVAGIASGVASANQEQNALLRQQNALLRSILEKDSSVRIGASAELGRVTRQSLNMYSGLVGG